MTINISSILSSTNNLINAVNSAQASQIANLNATITLLQNQAATISSNTASNVYANSITVTELTVNNNVIANSVYANNYYDYYGNPFISSSSGTVVSGGGGAANGIFYTNSSIINKNFSGVGSNNYVSAGPLAMTNTSLSLAFTDNCRWTIV
jgi:hypothetical protein